MITIMGTTHIFDHEALGAGSDRMSARTFTVRGSASPGSTRRIPIAPHRYGGELRLETDLWCSVSQDESEVRLSGECRLFEGAFETTTDEESRFAIAQDLTPGFATPFSRRLRSPGRRGGDFGQLSFLAVHDYELDSYRRDGRTIPRAPADDTDRLVSVRAQLEHARSLTTHRYAFAGSGPLSRLDVTSLDLDVRERPPRPPIEPSLRVRAMQLRMGEVGVVVDFENVEALGDNHAQGEVLASDTAMTVIGTGSFWSSKLSRTYGGRIYGEPVSYTVELFSTFPI